MAMTTSYTNASLVQAVFTSLGSISTLTDSVILLHAGQAEAYINAKIAKKYTLPFTQHIPILETLATDLAIYNILTTRISLRTEAGTHPWFQRFKQAMDTLNEIVDGTMVLVGTDSVIMPLRSDNTEAYSNTMDYNPTTFEGPLELQHLDPSKLESSLDVRGMDTIQDKLL